MTTYKPVLVHHGILGQKWGVRRYQNEDGSLTELGRRRLGVEKAREDVEKAKIAYKKSNNSYKAEVNLNKAKVILKNEKAYAKASLQKKKSKRQKSFEEQYKKNGMSDKDAEIQAYKRIRTERALVAVGATALAAAAAYVAYKHYDNSVDKVLKSGKTIGRVSRDGSKGVEDAFYTYTNKHDARAYKGLYGGFLRKQGDVYEKTITVKNDTKIASQKNALNIFKNLMENDKNFAEGAANRIKNDYGISQKQQDLLSKAKRSLANKNIDKSVYDAFNSTLTDHSKEGEAINQKFYDALKKSGYGAIVDVNDKKYSGYNAKNPLIVFDAKKVVGEVSSKKLSDAKIAKNAGSYYAELFTKSMIPYLAPGAAAAVAGTAARKKNINNSVLVDNYRKEHPETKKSNAQIISMLKKKG